MTRCGSRLFASCRGPDSFALRGGRGVFRTVASDERVSAARRYRVQRAPRRRHQAYLRAIDVNQAALPAPEVFSSACEAPAIVYLDRLCRTVHMLNYLRQTDDDGCLFLHVHARHILAVPHDHGEYFEGLLHAAA